MEHHLFVYGSLRSGFKNPAYEYISRYFDLLGDGQVKGRLYDMGEFPAGVPATDEVFIKGELYRIKDEKEFQWAIGQLDDYEGVAAEEDEQPLYYRDLVDVIFNGNTVKAWIYWFKGDTSLKPVIASGDLIEYLKTK